MSDLKRLENQLDQLEKSYKLGIISDDEYKKGKENLEKKIEPLKERKKKDEESKKIVDDILNEDKKTEKKETKKKKKDKKEEAGEKTMPKEKDKPEKKEDTKEGKKEDKKKSADKSTKKEPKKEEKSSTEERRKKRTSKKSRVPKWLWILLLLVAILAFITFTSPDEEKEDPDPLSRNVTGINETVQIEYYKSYACEYCKHTHETLKQLKGIYNHTINITYTHYPYNIELDFEMDMASECARKLGETNYSEKLYNATKPLEKEDMIELFRGNQTEFAECLNQNKTAEKVVTDYQRSVKEGIESVPTVKIDGSILKGNRAIGIYMAIIDNKLGIES